MNEGFITVNGIKSVSFNITCSIINVITTHTDEYFTKTNFQIFFCVSTELFLYFSDKHAQSKHDKKCFQFNLASFSNSLKMKSYTYFIQGELKTLECVLHNYSKQKRQFKNDVIDIFIYVFHFHTYQNKIIYVQNDISLKYRM